MSSFCCIRSLLVLPVVVASPIPVLMECHPCCCPFTVLCMRRRVELVTESGGRLGQPVIVILKGRLSISIMSCVSFLSDQFSSNTQPIINTTNGGRPSNEASTRCLPSSISFDNINRPTAVRPLPRSRPNSKQCSLRRTGPRSEQ